MKLNSRKNYLDILRLMAAFLVIYNHLPANVLYRTSQGPQTGLLLLFSMFVRVNVPIFFMISGSLLLTKEEPIKVLYKKRVLRFTLVLFVFSIAGYLMKFLRDCAVEPVKPTFNLYNMFCDIVGGNVQQLLSYWYLYAFLGFLILLPFLRPAAKQMNRGMFLTLLIGKGIVFSVLPILNFILNANGVAPLKLFGEFNIPIITIRAFFYPYLGYYLDHKVDIKQWSGKKIILLTIATLLGLSVSGLLTWLQGTQTGEFTENYVDTFTYLASIWIFLLVKWLALRKIEESEKVTKLLSYFGSLTFGIYLLDNFFKYPLYNKFETLLLPHIPMLLVSFAWCVFSMVVGGGLTVLMKKVPGFRNLL